MQRRVQRTTRLVPHGAVVAIAIALAAALAHGVHASLATAEYNAVSKSLEITLAASADDIQAMLRRDTGKEIEIDRGKQAEQLVAAYIMKHLELRDAGGKRIAMKWIGMEITVTKVTAYIEAPLPGGLSGLQVRNTLLFDFLPDQANIMSVRRDRQSKSSDHLFTPSNKDVQPVRLP